MNVCVCVCVCVCVYRDTHSFIYKYIYIYIERQRESPSAISTYSTHTLLHCAFAPLYWCARTRQLLVFAALSC